MQRLSPPCRPALPSQVLWGTKNGFADMFSPNSIFFLPKVFRSLREVSLERMPDCSRSASSQACCDTAFMRKAVLQPKPHFKAPLFRIFLLNEFDCVNFANIIRCRRAYVAAERAASQRAARRCGRVLRASPCLTHTAEPFLPQSINSLGICLNSHRDDTLLLRTSLIQQKASKAWLWHPVGNADSGQEDAHSPAGAGAAARGNSSGP